MFRAGEQEQNIILHGSQVRLDGVVNNKPEAGNFVYAEDNQLRKLTDSEQMLGFRYYVEDKTPNDIYQEDDPSVVTGIRDITLKAAPERKGVFTIDGRQVSDGDTNNLPAGVYIVNGKKMVVLR